MSVVSFEPSAATFQPATLGRMARKRVEGNRYFVRLTDEQKRRLDHLAVDDGAESTEAYGGRLLAEVIDRLWQKFDPKKPPRKAGGR